MLMVLAFLPIPVIIVGSLRYQKPLEQRYDAVRAAAGRIADTLTNNLGGIATIKAFTAEEREVDRVAERQPAYSERQRRGHPLLERLHPAHPHGDPRRLHDDARRRRPRRAARRPRRRLVLGARLHDAAPAVAADRLGETLDLYQRAMASCRRIFGLLDVQPTIPPGDRDARRARARRGRASTTCASPTATGAATCCTASTLDIPAGETHAIVGATGAGKSTVVKLLLRLYEPTGGRSPSTACRSTS